MAKMGDIETMTDGITRRDFLKVSGTMGAGATLIGRYGHAEPGERVEQVPKVRLGKTGELVSTLGFGSSLSSLPAGLLNMAVAGGATYIDTAQSYLNSRIEERIGAILEKSGRRRDCFLVTKTKARTMKDFESRLHASLDRLRTDYVDAYFIHRIGDPDRLSDEVRSLVERLKRENRMRFFGFSCHHSRLVDILNRAADVGFVDTIMFRYNFRDYDNDALNRAIDRCSKANIGLAAMKTQGGAVPDPSAIDGFKEMGFNRYQAAVKAVLADERIHVAVSEMADYTQVEENTTAARVKKIASAESHLLRRYAVQTDHLYCRGCGHLCEPACNGSIRIADTLRYRMYHDYYGKKDDARRLFRALPEPARRVEGVDFTQAEAACPHRVAIGRLMRDAVGKMA